MTLVQTYDVYSDMILAFTYLHFHHARRSDVRFGSARYQETRFDVIPPAKRYNILAP